VLQVTGLVTTLVAATAYFGTPDTTAMLRMMLAGVLFFIPGWLLARDRQGREWGPENRQARNGRHGGRR
jgi:hypothetical protein